MNKKKGTQGMTDPGKTFQPSEISFSRMRAPLSGRAMQVIREIKEQDRNSYLYLLMEDMLFTTAEDLSREKGTPEEIAAEYLKNLEGAMDGISNVAIDEMKKILDNRLKDKVVHISDDTLQSGGD